MQTKLSKLITCRDYQCRHTQYTTTIQSQITQTVCKCSDAKKAFPENYFYIFSIDMTSNNNEFTSQTLLTINNVAQPIVSCLLMTRR